jgi:hypothetical protein
VLARRIIVVSPDKMFGKQLAVALRAAGGVVDVHASIDELATSGLQAALLVMHLEGDAAPHAMELIAKLAGETRVIVILPQSNLAAVVDIMQGSERVAGMMIAEQLETRQLSAMATRVLVGDIFGLEKLIPWGTQIHSCLVGDYQEKSRCIAQVSELAEQLGVRRKYRESIEQCLDEMLMNALYDAPVDEQGRQIFAEIPTKTRISLRVEQKVVVQFACDGSRFAIGVRDVFGMLERATVLRYLHKCLHDEQQIDRKTGGAGLGLYLMTSSATAVYFNVLPKVATEVICVFDLDATKLRSFGFFDERIDAAGRLAIGPSRRLPAGASHPVERRARALPAVRPIVAALSLAIVATIALIVVVASRTKQTSIVFRTVPPGAAVEIDGKTITTGGDGTVVVGGLEVGRSYPAIARLDGHTTRQVVVTPHAGDNALSFELAPLPATVTIDSMPSGATIAIDRKAAGTTPVTLATLPPGTTVEITFAKSGYQDATTRLDVPRPGKELRLVQALAVSNTRVLRVTSNLAGKLDVAGVTQCRALPAPAECELSPGTYRVELAVDPTPTTLERPAATRVTRTVTIAGDDVALNLELGFVEAAPGKLLQLGGGPGVARAVLEVGPRRLTITDDTGARPVTVIVKAGATVVAN